ncbi:glycoside hydrolase family 2 TIM barrel-domain containing protein [Echinicola rosea]|uniref:beta-galactosidase n=1 Tax=Echinicola rosea TaxID=1807691 RepID=A0ABQ1VC57_9BACT|nr:glycoside hydrolase family 2 TIM barrel-domain containing protein [Echinicola rosea]GGF49246.1 beta-galactosidase [Echinicola rosea]
MYKIGLKLILIGLLVTIGYEGYGQGSSGAITERQYLSGTGKDDLVEWDFFCSEGRNSGKWTRIGVPSCWEQQGFGAYNYGQDPMDERAKEYGLYKHTFSVPKDWKEKEVKIVFEGVMTDAEVRINGELAGEIHQGAFYEFSYAITDLLKPGGQENLLEVRVDKVSSNESINYAERKADFWVFGGVFRPVYLEALPGEHIDRVAIDAGANGEIRADLYLNAPNASDVNAHLYSMKGDLVQKLNDIELKKSSGIWSIHAQADDIKTWNPEQPNLYWLALAIEDQNGDVLHEIKERIGFRTVEVLEGDGIYVNGQRIKFKGVNRHSFYPTSGRTTSKELSIEHVQMMKDMNMNAVRMSHYPPDVHFLDVCDSLGLFVIDEVCTWHSPHLDTEVGEKIVNETVVRDVNHPSILLWANGNESGWNTELDDDYAIWDIQKREVIHPWNIFNKTNTLHYFPYHALANDGYAKEKILFPTEFLHGLYDGGHGAGLEDYWELMWDLPQSAGGFLWDFADEAVVRTDKNGKLDTDGNHAADGIVGPYGEKEASYYTIKEIWSPIYIEERNIREGFNGVFRVENRHHFTNLAECTLKAKWMRFGMVGSNEPSKVLFEESVTFPDMAPGEKGKLSVDRPDGWQEADALHLTAFDPEGKEIYTWSYPVQSPAEYHQHRLDYGTEGKLTSTASGKLIKVSTNEIDYSFSKENGLLVEVMKKGKLIPLKNGPILFDHDDKVDTLMVEATEDKVEITVRFEERDKTPEWTTHVELSSDIVRWTVYPNGLLDLWVEMKGEKRVKGFKGFTFSFPEKDVEGMKWLGDGPYRVWRNRMKGTRFQVWENDYNNTVTGETAYDYPEFKGFYSSLYWLEVIGRDNNGFTVYSHSPHLFMRMLTPEAPSEDQHGRVTVKFPEGDISFLKNIPAIGTKFQHSDTMGPHGNTENYFGNDDEPIVTGLTFKF